MKKPQLKLQKDQLERRLKAIDRRLLTPPPSGWVRAIRESLGMTAVQLAKRMGVTKQTFSRFEEGEKNGKLTIESLRKIANALQCDAYVILIPRKPLSKIIEARAGQVASRVMDRSDLHMKLEAQGTDKKFREKQTRKLANEMISSNSRLLWED